MLAAIGKQASDHGRARVPGVRSGLSVDGCCAGPMQFHRRNGPPSTWRAFGIDADHDGRRNPYDPFDAVFSAARYLRSLGAPGAWRRAVFGYNPSHRYVRAVMRRARRIRAARRAAIKARRAPARSPRPARPRLLLDLIHEGGRLDLRLVRGPAGVRLFVEHEGGRLRMRAGRELLRSGGVRTPVPAVRRPGRGRGPGKGDRQIPRREQADRRRPERERSRRDVKGPDLGVPGDPGDRRSPRRRRHHRVRRLLADPNLVLSNESQRKDFMRGRVDRRLVRILRRVTRRHEVTLTSVRSDHDKYTSSGSISNHYVGRAIDIGAVDGRACNGSHSGTCGRLATRLGKLPDRLHPTELIYCFDPDGVGDPRGFARSDHCDHIHAGFDEPPPPRERSRRQRRPDRSGHDRNRRRWSKQARRDIPRRYRRQYRRAARRYDLGPRGWSIVAGIGKIETDHGRADLPGVDSGLNFAGCCAGPMQFNLTNGPPSTWKAYGVDGDKDGDRDPYDPRDAIPAAGRYLAASGAPDDWRDALLAYNASSAYVADVLREARRYRGRRTVA